MKWVIVELDWARTLGAADLPSIGFNPETELRLIAGDSVTN